MISINEDNKRISKIDIVFNEQFKTFVKKIQEQCKDKLEFINSLIDERVIIGTEEYQFEIREYIIEHQHEINLGKKKTLTENSPHSHSNFFAIMVSLLVNIDECNSFDDVMENVKRYCIPTNSSTCKEDGILEIFKCACSHYCGVEHLYIMKNDITKRSILIGCDCIEKYELVSPTEMKVMRKEIRQIKKVKKIKKEKIERKLNIKRELLDNGILESVKIFIIEKENKNIMKMIIKILKQNVMKKCILCKHNIDKMVYKNKCLNPDCDCKNKKLQKLYCYNCATKRFSKTK